MEVPACSMLTGLQNNPQWVWATLLSHPLGTQLCRHLLLFSQENLRSQKQGEAPAGSGSKNRLHLRMFPRECSLSAADGVSGRQVVGARGVYTQVCMCAWRVFCCSLLVQTRVCNREYLCVRVPMCVSETLGRAAHLYTCVTGPARSGCGELRPLCTDVCAHENLLGPAHAQGGQLRQGMHTLCVAPVPKCACTVHK